MAWNMGQREAVRALLAGHKLEETAAAQAVADALLRAVGRQAIIAAAADAVAALGCGGGGAGTGSLPLLYASVNPGGGQEDTKDSPPPETGPQG